MYIICIIKTKMNNKYYSLIFALYKLHEQVNKLFDVYLNE